MSKTRCIDGRTMESRPQHDDPYLEVDIGKCEDCDGEGCTVCENCLLVFQGTNCPDCNGYDE